MSWLLAAAGACQPTRLSDLGILLQVLWQFLSLSLFSLGGGNTLLAEYHHLAVAQFCWLTNNQFADLYALAEAAILLPSTLLMVSACLSWKRLEHSPWRVAFERGLGPTPWEFCLPWGSRFCARLTPIGLGWWCQCSFAC
jgi:chromate transporter